MACGVEHSVVSSTRLPSEVEYDRIATYSSLMEAVDIRVCVRVADCDKREIMKLLEVINA